MLTVESGLPIYMTSSLKKPRKHRHRQASRQETKSRAMELIITGRLKISYEPRLMSDGLRGGQYGSVCTPSGKKKNSGCSLRMEESVAGGCICLLTTRSMLSIL